MKRGAFWSGLAAAFLSMLVSSCSLAGGYEAACEKACSCEQECSDEAFRACLDNGQATLENADENGCGDDAEAVFACTEQHTICNEEGRSTLDDPSACAEERATLSDCLQVE